MTHTDLVNEVIRQLSSKFHPELILIKRRIENLIEFVGGFVTTVEKDPVGSRRRNGKFATTRRKRDTIGKRNGRWKREGLMSCVRRN